MKLKLAHDCTLHYELAFLLYYSHYLVYKYGIPQRQNVYLRKLLCYSAYIIIDIFKSKIALSKQF